MRSNEKVERRKCEEEARYSLSRRFCTSSEVEALDSSKPKRRARLVRRSSVNWKQYDQLGPTSAYREEEPHLFVLPRKGMQSESSTNNFVPDCRSPVGILYYTWVAIVSMTKNGEALIDDDSSSRRVSDCPNSPRTDIPVIIAVAVDDNDVVACTLEA